MTNKEVIKTLENLINFLTQEYEDIDDDITALTTAINVLQEREGDWMTELDYDSWLQGYRQGKIWTEMELKKQLK